MAAGRTSTALQWSASSSKTINSATAVLSDAFTFAAGTVSAVVTISADNQGTPASGDTVDIAFAYTTGDVLGDSGDDYDTTEHAQIFGYGRTLDTYGSNAPGEDPARITVPVPPELIAAKGFKLVLTAAQAASRNIVVRAMISEQAVA